MPRARNATDIRTRNHRLTVDTRQALTISRPGLSKVFDVHISKSALLPDI